MTNGASSGGANLAKPPAPAKEGAGRLVLAIATAVLILLAAAFPIYVILFTLSEGRAPVLGTPSVAAAAVATPPAAPVPPAVPEEEAAAPPAADPSAMVGGLLDRLDDLLAPLTR